MPNKRSQLSAAASGFRRPILRARGGFTIIELVVVIGIMIILVGITMPAIKSLTRNNNQKQAVNLITSLIANAHSMALQTHAPAGLVIYEDPTAKAQSSCQLVVATTYNGAVNTNAAFTNFIRAPRTGSQPLPLGIKIATLDDSATNIFKNGQTATVICRMILFDGNGQMVLRNGLSTDPSILSTDASAAAWQLKGGSVGVSSPGLVVYNGNDLQAAEQNGAVTATNDTSVGAWLKQNADVLIINAYTGNVIR